MVPPLMNDFIALQKDTALISVVAGTMAEAFLTSQIYQQRRTSTSRTSSVPRSASS